MQLTVRELIRDEFDRWDELATISPQRSIFAQRWWMEIVTGGEVRLLGCFSGDSLLAGMPIWPCRTLGVARLRQPPLTPYWGPLFQPLEGKYLTRLSMEMNLLRALAGHLAQWADMSFTLHPTLTNWLPFYWSGYAQMTRYTYRIEDLPALVAQGKAGDESLRRKIRHAQKFGLTLTDGIDPAVIGEMFRHTMERQGQESPATVRRVWPRLAQAAGERNCLFTSAAIDGDGNIHSARAAVWDDRYAYDILGGGDPRFRKSYSSALTMWHEIESMAERAPAFDFEGSILEPVERFFRDFGGELCPYMVISRQKSLLLNTARAMQGGAQALAQRFARQKAPRTDTDTAERQPAVPA